MLILDFLLNLQQIQKIVYLQSIFLLPKFVPVIKKQAAVKKKLKECYKDLEPKRKNLDNAMKIINKTKAKKLNKN